MTMTKYLKMPATCSIILAFLFTTVQAPAFADVVGTKELTMQAELQLQRNDVRNLIASEDMRSALLNYGVSPADIDKRINNLSANELLQIQNQLSELPVGADGVLGIVLAFILVFILLDLLGATDVFPRI